MMIDNPAAKRRSRLFRWAVFLIYLAAVLFLVSRHENWRDEAQAWLMVRDLSVPQLIAQMKYEGHPCLWHLILMPFAKLGFPYRTMNLISAALVAAAVWLLLFRSPVPLPLQCLALAGSALLYFLPVISRSYALIPLFLFLNAMYYDGRRERPLRYGLSLALLVQTHLYMIPVAGMLSLFWFFEALAAWRKDRDGKTLLRQALGLMLPLVSFLLFLAQITGVESSSAFELKWENLLTLPAVLYTRHLNLLGIVSGFMPMLFLRCPRLTLAVFLFFLFIPALIALLIAWRRKERETGKCCLLYLLFAGIQFAFYLLLLCTGVCKTAILALLPVWLLWVLWPRLDDRAVRACVLSVYCGVALFFIALNSFSVNDIRHPYTDAPDCAAYIKEQLPEDALIFQANTPISSAVLAYLDADAFYSLESRSLESYATWIKREPAVTDYASLGAWAREIDPRAETVYLLCGVEADPDYEEIMSHLEDDDLIYSSLLSPKLQDQAILTSQQELVYLFKIELS